MKHTMKKLIATLLAVVVLMTLSISLVSAADEPATSGKLDWAVMLIDQLECRANTSGNIAADYYDQIDISKPIEKQYAGKGAYAVSHFEESNSNKRIQNYRVWYPSELTDTDSKYPVIVMVNGTGITARKYLAIFEHLASWGFVVVGCDDPTAWDGWSAYKCLQYVLDKNENENSRLYKKLDTKNIGIDGHSQGGVGSINGATNYSNSKYYKAVISESCVSQGLSEGLEWPYDASKLNTATLFFAGTGNTDAESIAPQESVQFNYDAVNNGKMTAMARRVGAEHGDVLTDVEGYRTAWFCYHLKGDSYAGKAFLGTSAELLSNPQYQYAAIKNN